jgi:MFS transporter, DHA1 family, multidrug resistance protein
MTDQLSCCTDNSSGDRVVITNLRRLVFWVSFPFGVLNFLLPIYGKELGASALEIGGFFSAFSIVPALIRPFLGRALDRWGRKPFLLLGLVGYLLATIVFSLSGSVLILTLGRFLQGIGSAFLWIAAFTMIADLSGNSERGFEFGSIDEASYRGGIIGTSLGLGLVFVLEQITQLDFQRIWYWLFLIFLLPTAAACIIGWRGTRETVPLTTATRIRGKAISAQLLALMGIVLFTGASQAMVWPLLMIFLQDRLGAGIGQLAFAYLPAALLSSFLPSRMGRIADRWGRKGPMIVGLVVGSLASLAIPHLGGIVALAALWCLETLGYTIAIPAERAFVADIAGVDVRGSSYGLYTFAFFLGSALGPLAGGWLYDHVGKATPFYLNTVVLLIGALLVGFLLEETGISGQSDDYDLPTTP